MSCHFVQSVRHGAPIFAPTTSISNEMASTIVKPLIEHRNRINVKATREELYEL